MKSDFDATDVVRQHMALLSLKSKKHEAEEQRLANTPILTAPILRWARRRASKAGSVFSQYGLLGGICGYVDNGNSSSDDTGTCDANAFSDTSDLRLFFNSTTPSSTFICGSQGSGKSHTLSCMLENCLLESPAAVTPKPLTGLVFHYDTFLSDEGGCPCEAAYLSSSKNIKVRVLCAPTNIYSIRKAYESLHKVVVEPLSIDPKDLDTKRMFDLMAVNEADGMVPLYVHTIRRILREMRLFQQKTGGKFDYQMFKQRLETCELTPMQLAPLHQRLALLESFMPESEPVSVSKKTKRVVQRRGTDWTPKSGHLTIVDLSCPCVTSEAACSLFNVCLSIFVEQDMDFGRVIALDEAHKFMTLSAESNGLTNSLLNTVRLQRHIGVRIIISTQEPTVSPDLIDLCSMTVVHRFASPAWFRTLKAHLAIEGNTRGHADAASGAGTVAINSGAEDMFARIVGLRTGEALIFAPSAVVSVDESSAADARLTSLGGTYLKVKIRARITDDGGKSVLAQ